MKTLMVMCLASFAMIANGQTYKSVDSKIIFFSEAPLENITANNSDGASAYNINSNEIAFSVPIRSFIFRKALMQEHFNESYMESESYPKATFTGKVQGFDISNEVKKQAVSAKGDMTIHGVTRSITVDGTMEYKDGKIYLKSVFPVELEDYKIKIPQVLWQNIAEEVEVTITFVYEPV